MKHLMLLVLNLFIYLASSAPQKKTEAQKQTPFPYPIKNVKVIPYENATPYYKFDGIDYEELPTKLKNDYYSCYGEHMRCIRNRNYLHEICAYATWYEFGNYYSMCQLELLNCQTRVNRGYGVYGTFYSNDMAFFQGEGWNCVMSQNARETRRLNFRPFNPDHMDLYYNK